MAYTFTGLDLLVVFLIVHFASDYFKLYQKTTYIDIVTHFFGGLALGFFVKDLVLAIVLLLAWEALEVLLIRKNSEKFKETWQNKVRDLFAGLAGWLLMSGII